MERHSLLKTILIDLGDSVIDKKNASSSYVYKKGYLAEHDLLANKYILDRIKKKYPSDLIISEETDFSLDMLLEDNEVYTWVIDPICGTTNFLNNIPFYCHSISLLKGSKTIVAAVYDPNNKELFYSDGSGFFVNNNKAVTSPKPLKESLVCLNVNQSDWLDAENNLSYLIQKFSPPVSRRIHVIESANLELSYVACGRIDAYVNPSDKIWDLTAGEFFVNCAGGATSIINRKKNFMGKRGIIAANSLELLKEISEKLRS